MGIFFCQGIPGFWLGARSWAPGLYIHFRSGFFFVMLKREAFKQPLANAFCIPV